MTEEFFSTDDVSRVLGIDFDERQRKAIQAPLKPGVVIAGAGSGKTAVMTARVVYLVANRLVRPEEVLGLTFTNLATGELQGRVREALSALWDSQRDELAGSGAAETQSELTDVGEPTVLTYHAFAGQLIREFGVRIGIEPESLLLSDVRRQQLAMRMLRETQVSFEGISMAVSTALKSVLTLDDAMSDYAVNPDALIEFDRELAKRLEPLSDHSSTAAVYETSLKRIVLAQLVQEFRQLKRDADCLDYADMTRLSLEIFTSQPTLISLMRDRFKVVLLDEYQDTSTAQRMLMETLFGEGHALNAVGDALQSIYVFRGANPQNIDFFPQHFAVDDQLAPVFPLPVTQRNGVNIVAVANMLTDDLRSADAHPLAEPLQATSQPKYGPGAVAAAYFETEQAELEWLLHHIHEQEKRGVSLKEMALLLRRREDVGWFYRQLADAGVNVQVRAKQDLLDIPEVAEVVAYLRVIAEPTANQAWIRILTGPRFRISPRDLKVIAEVAAELVHDPGPRPRDLQGILDSTADASDRLTIVAYGDAVSTLAESPSPLLSADAQARLRLLAQDISYLRRHTAEPLADFVQRVMNVTGLAAEATAHTSRIASGMAANLRSFVSLAAEFTSLDGHSTLFAFLSWLEDAVRLNAQGQLMSVVQPNAVQLMTVHSAKGLQFRCVFVPRLADGIFPSSNTQRRWPTNANVIPDKLRPDVSDPVLTEYPPADVELTEKVSQPFVDAYKRLSELDERRLMYVAVTRAQETLVLSSAYNIAGESSPRLASKFLQEVKDHLTLGSAHVQWFDAPPPVRGQKAPALSGTWPVPLDSPVMTSIREAAAAVLEQMSSEGVDYSSQPDSPGQIGEWDRAIAALEDQFAAERDPVHSVALPQTLSVSQIQRLNKNESDFLADLIRPMPSAPAYAASQGTDFHTWVELRARGQMLSGRGGVLPGMEDFDEAPFVLTSNLEKFIETFEKSEWGSRIPYDVEHPFVYSVGGRVVRGVIDAIYQQPDGSWLLVDWKTNAAATADDLQLSIYRLAWARIQGCPAADVHCAFYYVALDQTVTPEKYYSEADVEEILTKDATIR